MLEILGDNLPRFPCAEGTVTLSDMLTFLLQIVITTRKKEEIIGRNGF